MNITLIYQFQIRRLINHVSFVDHQHWEWTSVFWLVHLAKVIFDDWKLLMERFFFWCFLKRFFDEMLDENKWVFPFLKLKTMFNHWICFWRSYSMRLVVIDKSFWRLMKMFIFDNDYLVIFKFVDVLPVVYVVVLTLEWKKNLFELNKKINVIEN